MATEDEDFTKLPLNDRLSHKNWKARVSAYSEYACIFPALSTPAEYKSHHETLKQMLKDPNAVALEAALSSILLFVSHSPTQTNNVVVPLLIEKCFASNRSVTRERTCEIVCMYIETADKPDNVIGYLLPPLTHKNPKIVNLSLYILTQLVTLFGVKCISPKPILNCISQIFEHKDKGVRSAGTDLCVALYEYLGAGVMGQFMGGLKAMQSKELNEVFEDVGVVKRVPERRVRSEQGKLESNEEVHEAQDAVAAEYFAEEEQPEPEDPTEFLDPVALLDKLPKGFYESLASSKWKDRKEALENFLPSAKCGKIEDGRYGELISVLGKRVADPNIIVATLSINCIEGIARGLGSNFSPYKNMVIAPLIERCKEKKQAVVDVIRVALDATFASFLSIDLVIDDITTSSAHKNPQIRLEVISWMTRSLSVLKKVPGKGELKALGEMFSKLMDDGDLNVRTAAAQGLGTLLKVVGGKGGVALLVEKLDPIKLVKVKEFAESAVIGIKGAKTASAPVQVASVKKEKENIAPRTTTGRSAQSKPKAKTTRSGTSAAIKKKPTSASSKTLKPADSATPKPFLEIILRHTDVSSDSIIEELLGESAYADLSSSVWKTRLATLGILDQKLKTADPAIDAEVVIRAIGRKPGWKDSNFQVVNAMIDILAVYAGELGTGPASLIVPRLADKLGDIKAKKGAGSVLLQLSEATTLGFVLGQMYDTVQKQKSPKVIADTLTWMNSALIEFGITGVPVKDLVAFLKTSGLASSNAGVRNAAVSLVASVRMFAGANVRVLLEDLNATLLAVVDSAFGKIGDVPAPSRFSLLLGPIKSVKKPSVLETSASVSTLSPSISSSSLSAAAPDDDVEGDAVDIIPRVDILPLLTPHLIDDLGNSNWKLRKEGLDALMTILDGAHRNIKGNLGSDLLPALRARLTDTNRNLAVAALDILAIIASSIGRPFEKNSKMMGGPVMGCLVDNKPQVRGAAISALDAFLAASGMEALLSSISQSLMLEQPLLRKELLKWVAEKFENLDASGLSDISCLLQPTLVCLTDRNADSRKSATLVLQYLIKFVGYQAVRDKSIDLFNGSQLSSITPLIEAARPAAVALPTIAITSSHSRSASSNTISRPKTPAKKPLVEDKLKNSSRLKAPSTVRKEQPELVSEKLPPLLTSDPKLKDYRVGQDRGMTKWTFDSPRKELLDFLAEQCERNFSPEVCAWMFSTDHYKERDFLCALTALAEALACADPFDTFGFGREELDSRFIVNADLILKYVTLRFFDTNTSMLIKCLELLEGLLSLMDKTGYHLSEYEASCFLPFFVNKTGDNKESMRVKFREIMKQFSRVYPASKFFSYVIKGLESKNARTRIECLEELATLIQRNGMGVCTGPSKMFPVIAAQIADRDAGVRNGAMNAITQAYLLVGDQVYKFIGRISDKDKSLLEEKLKRLAPRGSAVEKAVAESSIPKPSFSVTVPLKESTSMKLAESSPDQYTQEDSEPTTSSPVRNQFTLDFDKFDFPNNDAALRAATFSNSQSEIITESLAAIELNTTPETAMMDFIINQITDTDSDMSINALKHLEKTLAASPQSLAPYMDDIVSAITVQIRLSFLNADIADQSISRLCKHLVNMLVQLFSDAELSQSLLREPLFQCVTELLNRLLDPKLSRIDNGVQLTKALNVLMVRILENCNRNATFRFVVSLLICSVLLEVLFTSTQAIRDCNDQQMSYQAKFVELVMKCLWKMTKIIPKLIQDNALEVNQLILEVHKFLVSTPPSEWKRRAAERRIPQADMPLRTIKTILHELAGAMEISIFDHLELIPDIQSSHAVLYLKQMVENRRKKQGITSPINFPKQPPVSLPSAEIGGMVGQERTSPTHNRLPPPFNQLSGSPSGPVNNNQLGESDIRADLNVIFDRIRDKDQTKQGILQLYEFKRRNAGDVIVDEIVEEYVNSTGGYFQGYIRRGLQSHEETPPSKRRPMSMIATPTSRNQVAENGPSINNSYKERLEKIQQKFRSVDAPGNFGEGKEESDNASVIIKQAAVSRGNNRPLSVDSSLSPFSAGKSENRMNQGESQSYEALKERLNRMKLNMANIKN